jgi:hypothetical protein
MEIVCDHDFAMWAFGDTWLEYMAYKKVGFDLMESWNRNHGDLLLLRGNDEILESMAKMKELYEKEPVKRSKEDTHQGKGVGEPSQDK